MNDCFYNMYDMMYAENFQPPDLASTDFSGSLHYSAPSDGANARQNLPQASTTAGASAANDGLHPATTGPMPFTMIPFVQIHTTDVQPQKSSYGNSFRRQHVNYRSTATTIKSEPIKSENSEATTTSTTTSTAKEATSGGGNAETRSGEPAPSLDEVPMVTEVQVTAPEEDAAPTEPPSAGAKQSDDSPTMLPTIYKCDQCPFMSLSGSGLDSHTEAAHSRARDNGAEPLQCPGCSHAFYSPDECKQHLSQYHLMEADDCISLLEAITAAIASKRGAAVKEPPQKDPARKSRIYLKNVACLQEPRPLEAATNPLSDAYYPLGYIGQEHGYGDEINNNNNNDITAENVGSVMVDGAQPPPPPPAEKQRPKQKISIKSVDVLNEPALLQLHYGIGPYAPFNGNGNALNASPTPPPCSYADDDGYETPMNGIDEAESPIGGNISQTVAMSGGGGCGGGGLSSVPANGNAMDTATGHAERPKPKIYIKEANKLINFNNFLHQEHPGDAAQLQHVHHQQQQQQDMQQPSAAASIELSVLQPEQQMQLVHECMEHLYDNQSGAHHLVPDLANGLEGFLYAPVAAAAVNVQAPANVYLMDEPRHYGLNEPPEAAFSASSTPIMTEPTPPPEANGGPMAVSPMPLALYPVADEMTSPELDTFAADDMLVMGGHMPHKIYLKNPQYHQEHQQQQAAQQHQHATHQYAAHHQQLQHQQLQHQQLQHQQLQHQQLQQQQLQHQQLQHQQQHQHHQQQHQHAAHQLPAHHQPQPHQHQSLQQAVTHHHQQQHQLQAHHQATHHQHQSHHQQPHQHSSQQHLGHQTSGYQHGGPQHLGHQPMGHQPMGHQPMGHQPMGHQPMGHQQSGHQQSGHHPQTHQQTHQRGTLHLRTVDELNLMNKNEVENLIAPNLEQSMGSSGNNNNNNTNGDNTVDTSSSGGNSDGGDGDAANKLEEEPLHFGNHVSSDSLKFQDFDLGNSSQWVYDLEDEIGNMITNDMIPSFDKSMRDLTTTSSSPTFMRDIEELEPADEPGDSVNTLEEPTINVDETLPPPSEVGNIATGPASPSANGSMPPEDFSPPVEHRLRPHEAGASLPYDAASSTAAVDSLPASPKVLMVRTFEGMMSLWPENREDRGVGAAAEEAIPKMPADTSVGAPGEPKSLTVPASFSGTPPPLVPVSLKSKARSKNDDETTSSRNDHVAELANLPVPPLVPVTTAPQPKDTGTQRKGRIYVCTNLMEASVGSKEVSPVFAGSKESTGASIAGKESLVGGKESLAGGKDSLAGGKESSVGGKESLVGGKESLVGGKESLVRGKESLVGGKESSVGGKESLAGGKESLAGGKDSSTPPVTGSKDSLAGSRSKEVATGTNGKDSSVAPVNNQEAAVETTATATSSVSPLALTGGTSVRGRPFGPRRPVAEKKEKKSFKKDQGSGNDFKCSTKGCKFRFRKQETLEYHNKCHNTSTTPASIQCPQCPSSTFTNWNVLHTHLWRAHTVDMELYSCQLCDFKTPIYSRLANTHLKIHSEDRSHACAECHQTFKNNKQLKNHRRRHRHEQQQQQQQQTAATNVPPTASAEGTECAAATAPPAEGLPQCAGCRASFGSAQALKEHSCPLSAAATPVQCPKCGRTLSSKSSLKLHMLTHETDAEKRSKCDKCNYSCNDHNSLRRHRMSHLKTAMYQCQFCSYKSIQSSPFKKHIQQKHPEQASRVLHQCPKCPFNTVSRSLLTAHQGKHSHHATPPPEPAAKPGANPPQGDDNIGDEAVVQPPPQVSKIKVRSGLLQEK